MNYQFIVLTDHEIGVSIGGTYDKDGTLLRFPPSGKMVRTEERTKDKVDPKMCKEIEEIVKSYSGYSFGCTYAIVSSVCLEHIDRKNSTWTLAPLGKVLKFGSEEGVLTLQTSKKYWMRTGSYPPDDNEDDFEMFGWIKVLNRAPK